MSHIRQGRPDHAARDAQIMRDGGTCWRTPILTPASWGDDGGAVAFLIEQAPHCVVGMHFHRMAEFQVVVDGEGRMGPHPIGPLTVHYVNGHTTYGPIVAGPEGVSYMTLRPRTEPRGLLYMPEARPLLEKRPRRQVTSERWRRPGRPCVEAEILEMLPPDATGLAAWLVRLPAGAGALPPRSPHGRGCFHVVVDGSAETDEGSLTRFATAWIAAEAEAPPLRAGPAGLEMLVLQFPQDSWQPA